MPHFYASPCHYLFPYIYLFILCLTLFHSHFSFFVFVYFYFQLKKKVQIQRDEMWVENRKASKFYHARIHIPTKWKRKVLPGTFFFQCERGWILLPVLNKTTSRYQIGDTVIMEVIWYSKGMKLPRTQPNGRKKNQKWIYMCCLFCRSHFPTLVVVVDIVVVYCQLLAIP